MWKKLFGSFSSSTSEEAAPAGKNESINELNSDDHLRTKVKYTKVVEIAPPTLHELSTDDYWPTKEKEKEKRTKVAESVPLTLQERASLMSKREFDEAIAYKELLTDNLNVLHPKRLKQPAHHKKINNKTLPGNDYLQTKEERVALKEYRVNNVPSPTYITEKVERVANRSIEKAPPTQLEPIKPNIFDIEYPSKLYFPGRYHDYNGAHKVFPLKTIPGTVNAFFPQHCGYDPVFVEDELIPNLLQQRKTAIKKEHEKTKFSVAVPVRRFKKHVLDLSRKNVSNKFCNPNDPNADDATVKKRYMEYAQAWNPDPKIFDNIKKKMSNTHDDSVSDVHGNKHDHSMGGREKEQGVDDTSLLGSHTGSATDSNVIEQSSSLGANRSSHLDELSLLPSTLIKVRMQRNKMGKGLNKYHIKMPINMESKSTTEERLRRIHMEKAHLVEIERQRMEGRRKAYGLT